MELRLINVKLLLLCFHIVAHASNGQEIDPFVKNLAQKVGHFIEKSNQGALAKLKQETFPIIVNNKKLSEATKKTIKSLDERVANYFTEAYGWPLDMDLRIAKIGELGGTIYTKIENIRNSVSRPDQLNTLLGQLKQLKIKASLAFPLKEYSQVELFLDTIPVE